MEEEIVTLWNLFPTSLFMVLRLFFLSQRVSLYWSWHSSVCVLGLQRDFAGEGQSHRYVPVTLTLLFSFHIMNTLWGQEEGNVGR